MKYDLHRFFLLKILRILACLVSNCIKFNEINTSGIYFSQYSRIRKLVTKKTEVKSSQTIIAKGDLTQVSKLKRSIALQLHTSALTVQRKTVIAIME